MWHLNDTDAYFLSRQRDMERPDRMSQLVNSMSVTDRSETSRVGSDLVHGVVWIGAAIGALAGGAGRIVGEAFSAPPTSTP